MAEKFQYTLEYNSIATGTGAAETAAGMARVTAGAQNFSIVSDKAKVAQWAFYDLDAEITKTGNTIERVAAGPIKTLPAQIAPAVGGVKNLGMVATQVGYQVTDFATQVTMGTSAVTAFAMQAPQAIGALTQFGGATGGLKSIMMSAVSTGTVFSLVLTELAIGAKLVIDEYGRMTKAQDTLANSTKKASEKIAHQRRQQALLVQEMRKEFITGVYKKDAEYLERQVSAMERINELRSATGGAAAAAAQADVTAAQQSGGDVTGAKAALLTTTTDNALAELVARLGTAEKIAEKATQDLEAASGVLAEERAKGDENLQSYKDANAAFDAAAADAEEANAELENQRAIFAQEKAALAATTEAELIGLSTESQDAITKAAAAAQAEIEAKAAEMGGQLSSNANAALTILQQILADGTVKPEEIAQLKAAMAQMNGSREAANSEVLRALQQVTTGDARLVSAVQKIQADLEVLFTRIK